MRLRVFEFQYVTFPDTELMTLMEYERKIPLIVSSGGGNQEAKRLLDESALRDNCNGDADGAVCKQYKVPIVPCNV